MRDQLEIACSRGTPQNWCGSRICQHRCRGDFFGGIGGLHGHVLGVVLSYPMDENVIQIYEDAYVKHVRKDVIHEALKSCRCISQTKGHNTPFEGAVLGAKGGFPFVTFSDLDEVIHMLQVDFCIHGGLLWTVKEVGYMWKWVSVLFGDFIEALEVSAKSERAVFLPSEEDWSTVRREGGSDESHS